MLPRGPMRRSPLARFNGFARVDPDTGCWVWTGARYANGYGMFSVNRRSVRAHRWAYNFWREPIADGLVIDHLCRNRACVNPWHLEAVTFAENVRRGVHKNDGKTHCDHGHEFTPENTRVEVRADGRVRRVCRRCAANRTRARYWADPSKANQTRAARRRTSSVPPQEGLMCPFFDASASFRASQSSPG